MSTTFPEYEQPGGTWHEQLKGYIDQGSVPFTADDGADPSGDTPSTVALNAKLTELGPNSHLVLAEGTYLIDGPIQCQHTNQRITVHESARVEVVSGYADDVFRIGSSEASIRGVVIDGGGIVTEVGKSGGGATEPGNWTAFRFLGPSRGTTACRVEGPQVQWPGTAIAYEAQGSGWVNGNQARSLRVLYPRVLVDVVTPTEGVGYSGNTVTDVMGQYGSFVEYGIKNLCGTNWTLQDVSPWDIGHNPAAIGAEIAADARDVRIIGGLLTWQNFTNHAPPGEVTVLDSSQAKPWASRTEFYPEDYGAVADGQTDDRTAIQEAITAAVAVGGVVYFSRGKVYGVQSQVLVQSTDNVRIGGSGTVKMLPGNSQRAFLISNSSHITVQDITIDCNKAESSGSGNGVNNWQGIYVSSVNRDVSGITIRNVTVENGFQRGIQCTASADRALRDIRVEHCTVDTVGDTGIHIAGHAALDKVSLASTTGITVADNRITAPGNNGIQVIGASHVTVADNILDGVNSAGHGICFSTVGTDTWVTDFSCVRNKVSRFATDTGQSKWGVVVSNSCTRFTLSENIVRGCAGGITVDPEDGNAQDVRTDVACTISQNSIRDTVTNNGLNVRMSENAAITGNTVIGAALTGIALASSLHCTISGNTAVDNGARGVAIFGVEPGSGGHTVGVNTLSGNATEDFYNAGPPVPCEIIPADDGPTVLQPGADIQAALDSNDVVELVGTHTITETLTVPAGKTLRGATGATLQATASLTRQLVLSSGAVVEDLTVDMAGQIVTEGIQVLAEDCRIRRITFRDTRAALWGVHLRGDRNGVADCEFDGLATAIRASQGDDLEIVGNRVRNWTQRGIYVVGTATLRCDGLRIIDNQVTDLVTGGSSRYPIRIEGDDANRHQDMEIARNKAVGRGTAYTDATTPGTADQISVTRVDGLRMLDNISIDGGDGGMTIAQQCTNVTVTGNIIRRAEATGMFLGSDATTYVRGLAVSGNTITDCGQNHSGDKNRPSGIITRFLSDSSIVGNTIGNDAGSTSVYGMHIIDSTNLTLGPNTDAGNTAGMYQLETGNSGIDLSKDSPTALQPGADLQAALYSNDVVELVGTHTISSTITVPDGKTIRGGTIATQTSGRMISLGSGSVLEGVHIDAPGSVLGTMGSVEATGNRATIKDCRWSSDDRDAWCLAIQPSATDTRVIDSVFDRCSVGVFVNPGVHGLTVEGCTFTDWTSRCIALNATTAGFSKIRIQDNEFGPLSTDTTAAAPRVALYIRSSQQDYTTRDIEISNNRVYGNGLGHSDESMGPADMLSLHRLEDARVTGNYLIDPGEVGIHVGQGSRKVIISDNIVLGADTTGIVVGEVTNTYRVKDIVAEHNIVLDSQQDRVGDLPDTVTGGISFWHVDGGVISGNRSGNSEGNDTQGYGVKIVDCTNITARDNETAGARLGSTYVEASTGIRAGDVFDVEATLAADHIVNNVADLTEAQAAVTDTLLRVTINAPGSYDFSGHLIYQSSTTADAQIKMITPGGTSGRWVANATIAGASSANAGISRQSLIPNSTMNLGGVGGSGYAVALPQGRITFINTGEFWIRFAQGTAEASDTVLKAESWIALKKVG